MTSGLLVVAKNDLTHNNLANQFSNRTIKRMYGCLTWNKTNLINGKVTKNICRSKINRKKWSYVMKIKERQLSQITI